MLRVEKILPTSALSWEPNQQIAHMCNFIPLLAHQVITTKTTSFLFPSIENLQLPTGAVGCTNASRLVPQILKIGPQNEKFSFDAVYLIVQKLTKKQKELHPSFHRNDARIFEKEESGGENSR